MSTLIHDVSDLSSALASKMSFIKDLSNKASFLVQLECIEDNNTLHTAD